MKKIILSVFVSFSSLLGFSQISIDSADLGQVGDEVVLLSDSDVIGKSIAAGSASAQTFDYTGLGFSGADTLAFLNPSGSIGAGNFPNANLLISSGSGGDLLYFEKSSSAFVLNGVYGDPYGLGVTGAIKFTPDVLLVPFPLDYNDSYVSNQLVDTVILDTITGIFDSLRLVSTTTITSVVDAFGTLNLPNGSESVLRKYDVEIRHDTVFGQLFGSWQNVQESHSTQYFCRFLAKNKSYYMLEAEVDSMGVVLAADYQTDGSLVAGVSMKLDPMCYGFSDGAISVAAIGGTAPYQYTWSNGATGSFNSGLVDGSYMVTVTDAVNATEVLTMDIVEPDSISISSSLIGHDHGQSDGFIDIDVQGGTPSFSYEWSNGVTTKNLSSLDHGVYAVTVTDNNSCQNTSSYEVENLTSVLNVENSDLISIYPNPNHGSFTINTQLKWVLEIYDLNGRKIKMTEGSGVQHIEMDNQKQGIYIVYVITGEGNFQMKIQVQ